MIKIPVLTQKEVTVKEYVRLLKPEKNPEYKIFDVVDFEYVNKYFDTSKKYILSGIVIGINYIKNEMMWSYDIKYIHPGNERETPTVTLKSWELQLHNDR